MCNLATIILALTILPATFAAQNNIDTTSPPEKNPGSARDNPEWPESDSVRIQISNRILSNHLKDINLPFDSITATTFDENGKVWIGSKNGLWFFDGELLREYTYKDGLFDKNIHQLFHSVAGILWAATSTGPYALIDNHFYVFEPLKNQRILNISENTDNWFFLTENGIRVFTKGKSIFDSRYIKSLIITLILAAIGALLFRLIKQFKSSVEWKADLIRAEQHALLAQMNPHFIFNSLNSVQKYILANDKESAQEYLQKFASMIRKVLENSSRSTITVSEEIATLELYLQLESLRFDNGFDFEIMIRDNQILHFEIPAMLLQTFVENAVWHGLMNKESRGKIELRFSMVNRDLILCEIEDNGIGRTKAAMYKSKEQIKHKSKGTGIIKKRIELLNLKARKQITCQTIDLEEIDAQRSGTLVRLEIPVLMD